MVNCSIQAVILTLFLFGFAFVYQVGPMNYSILSWALVKWTGWSLLVMFFGSLVGKICKDFFK